jgi:broad specificity phosphatase PhoE
VTAPLIRAAGIAVPHPLVVIRHGETDWNVARRLQGHEDIPLNDRGRAQARRNGASLRDHLTVRGIDPASLAFVASPLGRAVETMRLVRAELGLVEDAFARDARLMELGFGRWAGLTMPEVQQADPHGHAERERDRWSARPPGGESMADGAARVRPLLAGLERPTVLVTHGGLIRVIHALLGLAAPEAASHLATPQDRFHRIEAGRVEWL